MFSFVDFLKKRLSEPLPGQKSHLKLAPIKGDEVFRAFEPKEKARKSAVAIILFDDEKLKHNYKVLFTLRSKKLKNHSGQISFPGGVSEQDEEPIITAIREAQEEVGIALNKYNFVGYLSELYVPPSNTIVRPVVFYMDKLVSIEKNKEEVESYFYYPLEFFAEDKNLKVEQWDFNGIVVDVPLWDVKSSVPLWGATAMILSELIELYKEYKYNNSN